MYISETDLVKHKEKVKQPQSQPESLHKNVGFFRSLQCAR